MKKFFFLAWFFFVIAGLLSLLLSPIRFIDLQLPLYGEYARSLLYNPYYIFEGLDFLNKFPQNYEGGILVISPLVSLLFYFFPKSLYTLNATGVIITSLFIFSWYPLLNKALNNINKKASLLFFSIPLPILMTASQTISLVTNHITSMILFGLNLQILSKGKGKASSIVFLIVLSFSLFIHPFSAVYIPCYFAYILLTRKNSGLNLIALIAILTIFYLSQPLIKNNSFHIEELTARSYDMILKGLYLPGSATFISSDSLHPKFLPTLPLYLLPVVMILFISRKNIKSNIKKLKSPLSMAIILSLPCTLIALLLTQLEQEITTDVYDGLRFFIHFIPASYYIFFFTASLTDSKIQRIYFISLTSLNIASLLLYLYPFNLSKTQLNARGYIGNFPLIYKQFDSTKLDQQNDRKILAPYYGMRSFYVNKKSLEQIPPPLGLQQDAKVLFEVGVGMAQNISHQLEPYYLSQKEHSRTAEISPDILYNEVMSRNCFYNESCIIPKETKINKLSIKLGWILTTPCTHIRAVTSSHPLFQNGPLSIVRPDITECPLNINATARSPSKTTEISSYPYTLMNFILPDSEFKGKNIFYGGWEIWLHYNSVIPNLLTIK